MHKNSFLCIYQSVFYVLCLSFILDDDIIFVAGLLNSLSLVSAFLIIHLLGRLILFINLGHEMHLSQCYIVIFANIWF